MPDSSLRPHVVFTIETRQPSEKELIYLFALDLELFQTMISENCKYHCGI